jgi:protein required for attachment to host cells
MTSAPSNFDPNGFHLAVVDARAARWMRATRTAAGRLHVEEVARLDEKWDEKEHHRPMSLTPHPDGHSYAGTGHVEDERRHRFAKQVAHWLGEQTTAAHAARVHVFAPAGFLGELRKQLPAALAAKIADQAHDLGRLHAGQIAEHPAVQAIPGADERRFLDQHLKRD